MAIVLPVAAGDHIHTGLAAADIALVLAGSALGGAVLGAAGASRVDSAIPGVVEDRGRPEALDDGVDGDRRLEDDLGD